MWPRSRTSGVAAVVSEIRPEEWGERYSREREKYTSLATELSGLLQRLCEVAEIDVSQIEARAKDVPSFVEKITRKRDKYGDPLHDMTDLVGLRVITYYREDVSRVGDVIRKNFDVDAANSVDKAEELAPDRFGYTSVHFVATLGERRSRLEEWHRYKGIRFEIQVRTVLQHAWAAVNHKLSYKSVNEAPAELRRRLFRLSALFELADEQFSSIRDQRSTISTGYAHDVARGNTEQLPLDLHSLIAYLESAPQVQELARMAAERGMPQEHVNSAELDRDRRDLLKVLEAAGFDTIADVDRYFGGPAFPRVLNFITPWRSDYDATLENVLTEAVLLDTGNFAMFTEIYDDPVHAAFECNMQDYQNGLQRPTGRTGSRPS
jgi:putative GTP pyrophosphokinase